MLNRRRVAQGSGDCPEESQALLEDPRGQNQHHRLSLDNSFNLGTTKTNHNNKPNSINNGMIARHNEQASTSSASFAIGMREMSPKAIDMKFDDESCLVPLTTQRVDNFVHYNLRPGDTLLSLSVKFACPIASIKRLNNLISDQEFYGLSSIKLPVGKLGVLQETLDSLDSLDQADQGTAIPDASSIGLLNEDKTLGKGKISYSKSSSITTTSNYNSNNGFETHYKHGHDASGQLSPSAPHFLFGFHGKSEATNAHDPASSSGAILTDCGIDSSHVRPLAHGQMVHIKGSKEEARTKDLITSKENRIVEEEGINFTTKNTNNNSSNPDVGAARSAPLNFIFKDLDEGIRRAKTAAVSFEHKATDLVQTIANSGGQIRGAHNLSGDDDAQRIGSVKQINEGLTDLGLSVHGLILFIFIVCLVGPLAYVIYLEETSQ